MTRKSKSDQFSVSPETFKDIFELNTENIQFLQLSFTAPSGAIRRDAEFSVRFSIDGNSVVTIPLKKISREDLESSDEDSTITRKIPAFGDKAVIRVFNTRSGSNIFIDVVEVRGYR